MNVSQFASLGGKARWKGKTKKQRSVEMTRIGKFRKKAKNKGKKLSTDTSLHDKHDRV